MVDPTFDHTLAILVALVPLLVAVVGAIVAIVQVVAKTKPPAAAGQQPALPATGVTAPTPADDDHADDAIAELRESKAEWRDRALKAEARLEAANAERRSQGLPTY